MSDTTQPAFGITENAAKRIAFLVEQEAQDGIKLRVSVSGGGCSGFQYGFTFDHAINGDDVTFEQHGIQVVIDEVSLELLSGSQLDFVEDLIGASFQISNPQATSSCGCGSSFSI
ncbi:MAG: iron-sulfur cluster insertion protein ErpA [Pseudomonadota bacterium]